MFPVRNNVTVLAVVFFIIFAYIPPIGGKGLNFSPLIQYWRGGK